MRQLLRLSIVGKGGVELFIRSGYKGEGFRIFDFLDYVISGLALSSLSC